MNDIRAYLLELLLSLPAVLLALSVHEMMHGFAAYKLGDPTAKFMGRLSLNPLRHIDPIGFICLLFFHFGWAKPVSVDSRFFKKPKRDMAITALAGPLSNFALALIFSFILTLFNRSFSTLALLKNPALYCVWIMLHSMIMTNLGLGVFNLIPIPPLDGSKVLYAFLPNRIIYKIAPYEGYIQFALFFLLALNILSLPIGGVVSAIYSFFMKIAGFILGGGVL